MEYIRKLTKSNGSKRVVIPSPLTDEGEEIIFTKASELDEVKDDDIVLRFD